jgi:hypothetical protein
MEQMKSQRRFGCGIVGSLERSERINLEVARHRCDNRQVKQRELIRVIQLRFLHRQVTAQAEAVRVAIARCVRWLAVLLVLTVVMMMAATVSRLLDHRRVAVKILVLMIPTATHRCVH